MRPVVVVISELRTGIGGVASHFRCLEPHLVQHVDYLATGAPRARRGLVATAVRLGKDWARVCAVVLRAEVRLLHVNPSLNARAVLREAWNVLAARLAGKKVVVFWHGWDWGFAARLDRRLWALLFRVSYGQADAHVVLASRFRDYLLQHGCTGPVYCESTAVPDELFGASRPDAPTSPGPLRLLFLSRIEKDKGIYVAIDTASALQRLGHEVSLVVAGDGGEREAAEEYVRRNGLQGISFVGYVVGQQKVRVLSEADVYLFPSNHGEGMPLSVLEAMAAGLPIVCTRVAGLGDFFEDGRMGYSTRTPSVGDFVERVVRLTGERQQWPAMARYNHEYAKTHFSASVVAARLRAIYGRTIGDASVPEMTVTTGPGRVK
jgi:glycosyltransferase involved in cell wall biosynthesis